MKKALFIFAAVVSSFFFVSCPGCCYYPPDCPQPKGVGIVSVGSTTAQVNWNHVGKDWRNANDPYNGWGYYHHYIVECYAHEDRLVVLSDGDTVVGNVHEVADLDMVMDSTVLISGLSPDTYYSFIVYAYGSSTCLDNIGSEPCYFRTRPDGED